MAGKDTDGKLEKRKEVLSAIHSRAWAAGWVGKREKERGELREGSILEMLVGVCKSEEWETCCTTLNWHLCAGVR